MVKEILTRRDFLYTVLRNLMIAVLAVITGILLFRKRNMRSFGNECLNQGLCSNCSESKDCPLIRSASRQ
ncbi:hypothetical protein JXQ31_10600 [candidate division KSB1 bacterium]|nr:hypothetical protein [candidate division KSB1 bacterium]